MTKTKITIKKLGLTAGGHACDDCVGGVAVYRVQIATDAFFACENHINTYRDLLAN